MTKAVSKMLAKKRQESSARFRAWRMGVIAKVATRNKVAVEKGARRACKRCGHHWHEGAACLQAHGQVLGDDDRWYCTKTCTCGES